jgi:hypothetical protein
MYVAVPEKKIIVNKKIKEKKMSEVDVGRVVVP